MWAMLVLFVDDTGAQQANHEDDLARVRLANRDTSATAFPHDPGSPTSRGLVVQVGDGMRVCVDCHVLTNTTRCPEHTQQREQQRGSREQRGYGAKHRAMRSAYQRRMDKGEAFTCWRCPNPIDPDDWALGHCDSDRSKYHGPECPSCNDATSSRRGVRCPHPSHPWAPDTPPPAPRS